MSPLFTSKVSAVIVVGIAVILLLMPFYALMSVWEASLFGHYTLLRLWKELLLVPLSLGAVWIVWKDKRLRHAFGASWLFRCMMAFMLLQLLLGGLAFWRHAVNREALGEGLIIDVRLMVIFFVAWAGASVSPLLRRYWQVILLGPAAIVVAFGVLQVVILPASFLSHFGYGPHTIPPYETVDQNIRFVRVQSTLRGANPLGAYLVVVLAAISTSIAALRHNAQKRAFIFLYGLAALFVLYFTFSRSAYIGTALAVFAVVWLGIKQPGLKHWALGTTIGLCILAGGFVLLLRHNVTVEDTFFHTSQISRSPQSSNQDRASGLQSGIHDVLHKPLGSGPGTAGPASEQNNHPPRIAENFFVQIGQETGWLGLGLFLAINILLGKELWNRRNSSDRLALVLFVSLIGLSFVNMLSHAWADDTLAYLWWGLAGITLAPIIQTKAEQHETATKTARQNHSAY